MFWRNSTGLGGVGAEKDFARRHSERLRDGAQFVRGVW